MLAPRHGQENLVALRQGPPKNMGTVGKTPMKVPLNDENAASVIGGKTGGLGGKSALKPGGLGGPSISRLAATPMVPGTSRAPLGNKTTNARARASRPGSGGKGAIDLQHTIGNGIATGRHSTAVKRRKAAAQRRSLRLSIRADAPSQEDVNPEPEFGPPAPADAPYESDVFPEGAISLDPLKPENLLRGYYEHFFDPVGDDGIPLKDKELKQSIKKAVELAELEAKKTFDEIDWSVADVPETRVIRSTASAATSHSADKAVGKTLKKAPASTQRAANTAKPRPGTVRPVTSVGVPPARAGAPALGHPRARVLPSHAKPQPKSSASTTSTSRVGPANVEAAEPSTNGATIGVDSRALTDAFLGDGLEDDGFHEPLIIVLPDDDEEFELKLDDE